MKNPLTPTAGTLAQLGRLARRAWRRMAHLLHCMAPPEFVEHHVLPVLLAVALGIALGEWRAEADLLPRLAAAQQRAEMEGHDAQQVRLWLHRWEQACQPLLSLPIESVPEIKGLM